MKREITFDYDAKQESIQQYIEQKRIEHMMRRELPNCMKTPRGYKAVVVTAYK